MQSQCYTLLNDFEIPFFLLVKKFNFGPAPESDQESHVKSDPELLVSRIQILIRRKSFRLRHDAAANVGLPHSVKMKVSNPSVCPKSQNKSMKMSVWIMTLMVGFSFCTVQYFWGLREKQRVRTGSLLTHVNYNEIKINRTPDHPILNLNIMILKCCQFKPKISVLVPDPSGSEIIRLQESGSSPFSHQTYKYVLKMT